MKITQKMEKIVTSKKPNSYPSIVLIVSVLIAVFYLSFYYSRANTPKNIPLKIKIVSFKRIAEKGKKFEVRTILWSQVLKSSYSYSLQGEVIRGDCYIESLNICSNLNDLKNSQEKSAPLYEKKFVKKGNKGILEFNVKHQIYIPEIKFTCVPRNSGEVLLVIKLKLKKMGIKKNIIFMAFQAFVLISVAFIFLKLFSAILFVFSSRFKTSPSKKAADFLSFLNYRQLLKMFLTLIFMFDVIFLLTYLDFFRGVFSREFKILLITNISLFFFTAILFILLKKRKKTIALIFLFFVVLAFNFKFIPKLTGDAVLWEKTYLDNILWNSEILSQLINYISFDLLKLNNFNNIFLFTSKILVTLFIMILLFLSKEIFGDIYKRSFFLAVTITSTYFIFFLGYPEYAYWAIPLQFISLLLLLKYLKLPKQKYLIWLSISLGIGIYLHGSIVFIIPAIIIFVILKYEEKLRSEKIMKKDVIKKLFIFSLKYILPITLILIFFRAISSMLGYRIIYESPLQEMLVTFNPDHGFVKSQCIFLEPDHLKLISFILFLSMPSFILMFPFLFLKKNLRLDHTTKIILIFSLFQLVLILFWNFDYYIRDFDLFLSNTVFTILLLHKLLADNIKSRLLCQMLLIFILSISSGIGLIVMFTSRNFLFLFHIVK